MPPISSVVTTFANPLSAERSMQTVERQSAQACTHRQLTVRVTVPSTHRAVRARCRAANATRSAPARASSRPAPTQRPPAERAFHCSINPLPQPVRGQLKTGGFWHRGCPVALSGLRLLTVSHRGFDGRVRTGHLVVNKNARPRASVLRQVYRLRFPLRHMRLAGMYWVELQPPARR
jgi:hypothetical protein